MGGLAALDQDAMLRFGVAFVSLVAEQLDAILADISTNERDPATPLEQFFVMSKQATIRGYYSSEIGIHRELRYRQSVPAAVRRLRDRDGKDCPHCGQNMPLARFSRQRKGAHMGIRVRNT
jgi:hypothetical protein